MTQQLVGLNSNNMMTTVNPHCNIIEQELFAIFPHDQNKLPSREETNSPVRISKNMIKEDYGVKANP
jgi:hypothetical protein